MKQFKIKKLLMMTLMLSSFAVFSQKTISGSVTDDSGVPLPGATVVVDGTDNGTTSDFDGNYSIEAENGQTITLSYVGYESISISVSDDANFNVSLSPVGALDEVVITALGLSLSPL